MAKPSKDPSSSSRTGPAPPPRARDADPAPVGYSSSGDMSFSGYDAPTGRGVKVRDAAKSSARQAMAFRNNK